MSKTLTKKQLDNPKRWSVYDRFHEAYLWGALHGVFNLKEDKKANDAFQRNDLDTVKSITHKRINAVGKGKPKFKKVPAKKIGYEARTVKGSMAQAAELYSHKLFGKPKPFKEPKQKSVKKKKPAKPVVERKPLGPVNPDLPQNNAQAQAKKKIKPGEVLLYVICNDGPSYTAVYANKKTKKRRKLSITAKSKPMVPAWEIQMRKYAKKVAAYLEAKEEARKKKKPVKAKAKKKKKS